jgi:hypothetical protein
MKTTNKTGHKENVTNLNVLSSHVSSFGIGYNPSNPLLAVSNLDQISKNGQMLNDAVDSAEINLHNARTARSNSFENLDSLTDRSVNALKVSGVSPQTIEQAKSLAREVHGRRASQILTEEEIAVAKTKGEAIKQVNVHNSSFNSILNSFSKYVSFVNTVSEYRPNEPDINPAGLDMKLNELKTKSTDVLNAETGYDTARFNRNTALYADNTGLVDTAMLVKTYIKSAFGSTSSQYKQISNLTFKKLA